MNLTNLLQRLLGGADAHSTTREKRETWRIHRRLGLPVVRSDGSEMHLVAVNFGTGGIRVETPERLQRGERLEVLAAYPGRPQARFGVEVVWCRARQRDQGLEAGLRFLPSQGAEARAAARFMLEECKVSVQAAQEHRRAPRLSTYRLGVVCTPDRQQALDGKIGDLAIGGALCVLHERLPRGTQATLSLHLDDGKPPLECRGRVVRTASTGLGQTFEVAFTFDNPSATQRERLVRYLEALMGRVGEGLGA